MIETFTFERTAGSAASLGLTGPALAALGRRPGRVVVAHGARRIEAATVALPEAGYRLPVSRGAADALGLVAAVPYRLRWVAGELRIGPVIGILATKKAADLDVANRLSRYFLLRYPAVGGLVYLFGMDDVDLATETIEGLAWVPGVAADAPPAVGMAYKWRRARQLAAQGRQTAAAEAPRHRGHPRSERFRGMAREFAAQTPLPEPRGQWYGAPALGNGRFVLGRYPFPAALWRQAGFRWQADYERLIARLGPRLFNSDFFNKQEGFRLLAGDPDIAPHLPETEPLHSPEALFARLERSGKAILKRQEGSAGQGLMRVDQDGEGLHLRCQDQEGSEHFADPAALAERLAPMLQQSRYLLQQCIDLPHYRDRPNDYRVILQKDDRGRWVLQAVLGRFGRPHAVATNFVGCGYALPGEEALGLAFGLGRREAFRLQAEMVDLALAVVRALDASGGCYGDLGLDIAVDRERRLWLFEVNKLPYHELPLYAGDEQAFLAAKSGPLLFAAHLAGFGRD